MENPDRPGDQPRPKTPKPTTEPTHNKHKRPHASTGGFRLSGHGGDGAEFPWRYWVDEAPSVSTYKPGRRSPSSTTPPLRATQAGRCRS